MAVLKIALTDASKRLIDERAARVRGLVGRMGAKLEQGLEEAAAHVQDAKLTGTYTPGGRRGGQTPAALRSGALRQAIMSRRDAPLSGFVGARSGPTSRYAKTILGDETTTIQPRSARHLWIPIADNLGPSGQQRHSPRELMARRGPRGGRLLSIFTSKSGNLVAFLKTGGTFKRGDRKGRPKGRLMFVLKGSVDVQGTDALAEGVQERSGRIAELLSGAVRGAFEGGTA